MFEIMNAPAILRDWVGRSIDGRFPLLQWLGGSPRASVFLTELSGPSQKATIKLVLADAEDAETRMTAWEAATAISHPNLMQVFTYGRCQIDSVPLVYVVTEFADEVLAEILRERPLTPQETREMLGPALDALAYLHGNGFVHSRLKPSNIMAVADRLKLSADGLSFAGTVAKPLSERTVFDAPETAHGLVGPAADIWSLGATLVEVLRQRPPVWDGSATSEPVVPGFIPQTFATLARDCLRTDPARRCTLQEIKARLEPGAAVQHPARKAGKAGHAKGRVVALIAAVGILLAAIGIWKVLSHQAQPPSPASEEQNLPAATSTEAPAATPAPAEAQAPALPASPEATPVAAQNSAPAPVAAPPATSAPAQTPAPAAALPPPQTAESPASSGATAKGAVTEQVQPDVLPSALKTITGTIKVEVRLAVDERGNVTDAALESAGPSKYFANKALEAARRWQFKPAQVDGRAVPSAWLLHFQFKQSGITVTPEKTAP
jgi:TonB family protein